MNKWLSTGILVSSAALSSFPLLASDAPEYLRVREPISGSLEEVPSTTEGIGITPESWSEARAPFSLHPSVLLPKLREDYVQETGWSFVDDLIVSVRPRLYYFHSDQGEGGISEAFALGGALAVESGWLNDVLRVNLTGYTSQKLYGPADRDGSGLLAVGQRSYTVLGEAFAEIKVGPTSLFAGRTAINIPYINGQDIRMTPHTFEGIGFRSTALGNLQLGGGHLTKIKPRTSSTFIPMSEKAGIQGVDRGVSVVGLRYNFTDDYYIGIIEQYGWDMYNTIYVESDYLLQLSDDLSFRIGGQFTDQRAVGRKFLGSFNTQTAGAKAVLGYKGLIAAASFTWTAKGSDIMRPWGGTPSFNSSMIQDFDRAGEKSVRLSASYDLGFLGLNGFAASGAWILGDTPDRGSAASPDQREINFTIDYRPDMDPLRDFWLRVRYARNERDRDLGGSDREDFRVILNYNYSF